MLRRTRNLLWGKNLYPVASEYNETRSRPVFILWTRRPAQGSRTLLEESNYWLSRAGAGED